MLGALHAREAVMSRARLAVSDGEILKYMQYKPDGLFHVYELAFLIDVIGSVYYALIVDCQHSAFYTLVVKRRMVAAGRRRVFVFLFREKRVVRQKFD